MKLKIIRQIIVMAKYFSIGIFLQALLGSLLFAGNSSAQKSIYDIEVDIKKGNNSLAQLIETIEEDTEFYFSYETKILSNNKSILLEEGKASVGKILTAVSKNTNLRFKRINNNIVVKKKLVFSPPIEEVITENEEQVTVSGVVTEGGSGEPLPGVSILIKGTSNGTTTDIDGAYNLQASPNDVLQFSYIGYLTAEFPVGNQSTINVSLEEDVSQLEEVLVVGYGTVNKSDITGSVSSVKSEELTAYPALGTVQALQGRAAGVQITANNGEPGSSYKVRIRGGTSINASSDPIFVVDGFVGAALPPPEDIASIEILKDASATAIYGSRGANGVIMVTTKRGTKGKTNIDLNVSYSLQNEINRLDLLNASQFQDYMLDANPDFTGLNGNTDWQDEIFQTGNIKNYQLGISGGTDNVSYYISGTYYDQKGIVLNSDYKRFSVTSNIDITATEKFKFGLNLFARRTDQEGVRTQEGSGGANNSGVIASAFKFEPDQGIRDANGVYTLARLSDPHDNPVAIATEFVNENLVDRFQGNLYGEYSIFDDLTFRITLGASADNGRRGQYNPTVLQGGMGVGGDARLDGTKGSLLLNENYLTYSKNLGDHDITVMAGYSYQHSRNESWGGRGQSFPTDAGIYWGLGTSSVWQSPNSRLTEWELSSWYGRANYSFKGKYLLTLNARYDGSSVFSEGNKWAFFPSGAFAWNMKEEGFMQGIDAISDMKWRVSYGLTGNRAIGPFQTLASLGSVLTVQNGVPVNAVAPTAVANDELTWETTAQFDVGLDIGFLNGRLNVVMDYYRMETTDLLFSVPLPEYSGYSNQLKNIGSVENKGFEFTLSSRNLVGEFQWSTDFNLSINRNQILSLPDGLEIPYRSGPGHMVGLGDTQLLREGEPVGTFFGWIYDGVYQEGDEFLEGGGFETEAGGEKFQDINNDGVLDSQDRTIIGDPNPDFIWGLNNDFSWKGFDLNVFFQASQGNDIFSYTLLELDLLAGRNNATTAALNRWTPQNTNTDVPAASGGRSRRASTRWVRDGSFVRLKNLALGYNFPSVMLEKFGVRKLRLYVSAQNILTITDYDGYDPEVNYRTSGSTNGNRNLGLDYASYPNAKSYTFGLNLGF